MTAPEKPGLSNEEFIKKCHKLIAGNIENWTEELENTFGEALDRLEALIGQGKPTSGQIGLVDGDKLFAYLITQAKMGMDERDQDRVDTLRDVAHVLGRFSVSGQGQEERALKEQLVSALEEMRHVVCYYRSLVLDRSPYFRNEIALDKTTKAIANTDRALASADKAQDGKGDGK